MLIHTSRPDPHWADQQLTSCAILNRFQHRYHHHETEPVAGQLPGARPNAPPTPSHTCVRERFHHQKRSILKGKSSRYPNCVLRGAPDTRFKHDWTWWIRSRGPFELAPDFLRGLIANCLICVNVIFQVVWCSWAPSLGQAQR